MARPIFAFTIENDIRGERVAGVVGLSGLERRISDLSPAWPRVADAVRLAFSEAFAAEGNAAGKWFPLTERYRRWKERHYPGSKILELTGRMKASLTQGRHPEAVTIATRDALFISSDVPYARYHQHGTTKMVARPPIALTSRQKSSIAVAIHRAFAAYLAKRPAVLSA